MKKIISLMAVILCMAPAYSQDDLMNLVDEPDDKGYASATFKGTRIILGHSVETKSKNELEFLISHRFGRINSGAHNLFGLDQANIRLGLEYGISENLNVGVGRSSYDKTFDGFLKYRIVQQSEKGFPFSVVLFNSIALKTTPKEEDDPTYELTDRLANTHQLLIAKKFSNNFSLQVMPVFVHKNRVESFDENNQVAIGVGGRIKLTKRLALNAEYYYRLDPPTDSPYKNSVAIGFDIETGGHVFQLHFTNSVMTVERSFITENRDDFFDGDIHFGFNISRTFSLGGKKEGDW
ncbi:DUF5777 family beta-barrel protein [Fulvivirga imtechensis]|nr:DUF5777 family beta-barrel protein [Fulvivirga imtechensis]